MMKTLGLAPECDLQLIKSAQASARNGKSQRNEKWKKFGFVGGKVLFKFSRFP